MKKRKHTGFYSRKTSYNNTDIFHNEEYNYLKKQYKRQQTEIHCASFFLFLATIIMNMLITNDRGAVICSFILTAWNGSYSVRKATLPLKKNLKAYELCADYWHGQASGHQDDWSCANEESLSNEEYNYNSYTFDDYD